MQDAGEAGDVVQDPGDVGRRAERPDLPGSPLEPPELVVQVVQADPAVRVERDVDVVADRLPPGDVVGVMLHHRPEDDGPLLRGDRPREGVALLQLVGDSQPENVDEPVDHTGRARADGDQDVIRGGAEVAADPGERALVVLRHHPPRGVRLGVGVRHERQDALVQLVLHVPVEAPGGDEVEVAEGLLPTGGPDRDALADHAGPEPVEELRLLPRASPGDRLAGNVRGHVDESLHETPPAPVGVPGATRAARVRNGKTESSSVTRSTSTSPKLYSKRPARRGRRRRPRPLPPDQGHPETEGQREARRGHEGGHGGAQLEEDEGRQLRPVASGERCPDPGEEDQAARAPAGSASSISITGMSETMAYTRPQAAQ